MEDLVIKKAYPDLYLVYKHLHIEIELKSPKNGGNTTSMQLAYERKFKNNQTPYIRSNDYDEIINYVESVIKKYELNMEEK